MAEKKFDPGFGPRFQPGYEGEPVDFEREDIPPRSLFESSVDDVQIGVPEKPAESEQPAADAMKYVALTVGFATVGGLLFLHARNNARKTRRHSLE